MKTTFLDIDGGYSDWTTWSGCSHTCGGGRKERNRLCVNPPQQDNGKHCDVLGNATQTKKCNTEKCKGGKYNMFKKRYCLIE